MSDAPAADPRDLLRRARDLLVEGRVDEADRVAAVAERGDLSREDLRPLRLDVARRMADGYLRSGRIPFALGHLQQAVQLGADAATQVLFLSLLFQVRFPGPVPSLKPILAQAFEQGWLESMRLGRLAATLFLLEPAVQALRRPPDADTGWVPDLAAPAVREALCDPLLLTLLARAVVADPAVEALMVDARRAVLVSVSAGTLDPPLRPFAVALANQAFANEYAYPVQAWETEAVADGTRRIVAALTAGRAPRPDDLVAVAAYRALHTIKSARRLLDHAWPEWLAPVLTRQLAEPSEEAVFKRRLPNLTLIQDTGSRAVKAQYEDNPFPRWVGVPVRHAPMPFGDWLMGAYPLAIAPPPPEAGSRHQVLIAGCGAGQETATLAGMLPGVDILAIDLSRASLAHAARRASDLALDNVEFACADILELSSLGRSFDLVVSAGVLHHLDDPLAGWRVLTEMTRPGGAQLIALYSGQGRRHLAAARAFAREKDGDASTEGLRRYRAEVLALDPATPWRSDLLNRDDFYSLSMLRDLVFHVRETAFDLSRVGDSLKALGLRFAGMGARPEVVQMFMRRFGAAADPLSLDQWAMLETEVPDAFWHMYHFLAQRPQ